MKFFILLSSIFIQCCCFGEYYSQCDQDKYVNETFFKNKRNGIFVDIGAHSGIEISNTYFFEKTLDWTGICIEPIPDLFSELKKNRKCICIQGCISDHVGKAQFIKFSSPNEWFSGLSDKYNPNQIINLENYGVREHELIEVDCFLLNDLLDSYDITHIDFLSIDTEGGEFDIISSIDFSIFQIDVITIEDNFNDSRFLPFLNSKGFEFVTKLEQDLIFVNYKFSLKE